MPELSESNVETFENWTIKSFPRSLRRAIVRDAQRAGLTVAQYIEKTFGERQSMTVHTASYPAYTLDQLVGIGREIDQITDPALRRQAVLTWNHYIRRLRPSRRATSMRLLPSHGSETSTVETI